MVVLEVEITAAQQALWQAAIDVLATISGSGVGLLKVNQYSQLEVCAAQGVGDDSLTKLCQLYAPANHYLDLADSANPSVFVGCHRDDNNAPAGLYCELPIYWPSKTLFGYICLLKGGGNSALNHAQLTILFQQCVSSIERDLIRLSREYHQCIEHETNPKPKVSLQQFIDSMDEYVWIKDRHGRYSAVNQSTELAWGLDRKQILDSTDKELFPPELAKQFSDSDKESIARGVKVTADELQGLNMGPWIETRKVSLVNDEGDFDGIVAISRNISSLKAAQDQLELAAQVFKNSVEGIVITDVDGTIIDAHGAFSDITGYEKSEVLGKNPRVFNSGRHEKAFFTNMWQKLLSVGKWQGEIWNRRKSGAIFPQQLTIIAVYGDQRKIRYFVAVFADLSTQKKNEAELASLAFHDPLTKLPNRMSITSRLEQEIQLTSYNEGQLAVVYIDVDLFKQVNESFGYISGDKVLVELANRFRDTLCDFASVARLSGDEFAVILPNIASSEMLSLRISQLQQAFETPFIAEGCAPIRLTGSIGVAIYPDDGLDSSTLLVNADAAMHRAKCNGRNDYAFYTQSLTYESMEHLKLQSALHDAVKQESFYLEYQPKVDCHSQNLSGFEALLRWNDPVLGLISPAVFIPVAEKIGVIQEIGRWVLQQACEQGVKWLSEGKDFVRIAVNVASPQLQRRSFVTEVADILELTGLPAHRLELEVTESCMMFDTQAVARDLVKLSDMGITLSIDDFGTGYSSLNYLKKLPINKLKIDQSFVRDIPIDANNTAIAKAVIALGHSLNLKVIAEGVETAGQAYFLATHGCDEAQGYLYSKPKAASEFDEFFIKQAVAPSLA
ncbi:sensor domain-containing protein [Shewanella youngdeokensis]|uniref:EAL domain-containing protein n=1 Tax=Shewanella youngdeokensis TaxID=2999068 RepID=A0ABZ0K1P1_9GAMM|nr:EAL domain-containing protein [Shewanella sp. DAU334]